MAHVFMAREQRIAVTVVGYATLALTMVWIVLKIGAGKRWARSSLLLGFILDVLYTLPPPHQEILGYLTDVPDLGLQIYALVMLYTAPVSGWFNQRKPTPVGA
jgi:hypothetical protein